MPVGVTLSDVDPIRAALTEAMARGIYFDVWGHWPEDDDVPAYAESRMRTHRKQAAAALPVVESWAPTKPCPDCWDDNTQTSRGRIRRELHDYRTDAKWDVCPTCHGSGSVPPVPSDVPGIIELLCERVERVYVEGALSSHWSRLDDSEPVYRLRERKP